MWEKEISTRMNLIFVVIVVSDGNTGIWNVKSVMSKEMWGMGSR